MKITRRRLLLGGTASVCAAAAGTAYWGLRDDDKGDAAELSDAAAELFGDADGTEWLGRAYLRAHPRITTKEQLTRRMLAARRSHPSTADELRQLIRREYAAGRMVAFEGWYFAESEAAAAALVALG